MYSEQYLMTEFIALVQNWISFAAECMQLWQGRFKNTLTIRRTSLPPWSCRKLCSQASVLKQVWYFREKRWCNAANGDLLSLDLSTVA